MHAGEADLDAALVARLLAAQFPRWAELPIKPVRSAGTDNALFRLGADMLVRLPRILTATGQVDREHLWLPRLAPLLPLAIPVPIAKGKPAEAYPWQWSIYGWLEGDAASDARIADEREAAIKLGEFVAALQQIDPAGGPPPGEGNSYRGAPLISRDSSTRDAIITLRNTIDADAVTAAWEAAVQVPAWQGTGVWLHGDLHAANLLARYRRIRAVIDFGCMGVGDPACDVMVAWTYLSASTRDGFRAALPVDDATWARGRGWALSFGLIALPYYQTTNPVLAGIARRSIDEVLADKEQG